MPITRITFEAEVTSLEQIHQGQSAAAGCPATCTARPAQPIAVQVGRVECKSVQHVVDGDLGAEHFQVDARHKKLFSSIGALSSMKT